VSRRGAYRAVTALLAVVAAMAALAVTKREAILERLPPRFVITLKALRHGVAVDHGIAMAMRDGTVLRASLYKPRASAAPLPTVYLRLPYGRIQHVATWDAALFFAQHGYAALVQDLRGSGDSAGELLPWRHAAEDGVDTLDWIASQPWSNGRVATHGCSALGETQFPLARHNHPAHRAMIAAGAGGGIGSAAGRYGYFGTFEGGVPQLASLFGWFVDYGPRNPRVPAARPFDRAAHLRTLPVATLVERVRPGGSGFDDFLATPLGDARWRDWGYLAAGDSPRVPAMVINTWGDQTVGDTLAVAEQWRRGGVPQKVVIGPGDHCHHRDGEAGKAAFGEIDTPDAARPYEAWFLAWFDHWLRDRGDGLAALAPYSYYMLREDRWLQADAWPPTEARPQRWYLGSAGRANSRAGNGLLADLPRTIAREDAFDYDPLDPVPSRGGPVCCTGNAADRSGPADQAEVESRQDVLVYTSEPLATELRIAGPIRLTLRFASSAPDTDVVARLADVSPDGRSISFQEGALRLRYRDGFTAPTMMQPGKASTIVVDMRSIGYRVARGHRLRLHVTSSSFPRLERNLNTGAANNAMETATVVARNRVLYGEGAASFVEIFTLPAAP
jgi:putative CocE/NonD family hydrolase